MQTKFVLLAALTAGLLPIAATAQATSAPEAPAAAIAPAAPAHVAPQAYPAKIALIAFQQAVINTNEGQSVMATIRAKFEPKQAELEALNAEIEKLKKELQAAPATTTEAERSTRMKSLDSKQKQLEQGTQTASAAYQADLQEAYGKVAEKVHKTLLDYVQTNGYTILFDVSNEQSPVIWTQKDPSADITMAVIDAYNTASGVAAPVPHAPAAAKSKPATTTPHAAAKPSAK
jgi:Skp family chaperone for outer membrane proteins